MIGVPRKRRFSGLFSDRTTGGKISLNSFQRSLRKKIAYHAGRAEQGCSSCSVHLYWACDWYFGSICKHPFTGKTLTLFIYEETKQNKTKQSNSRKSIVPACYSVPASSISPSLPHSTSKPRYPMGTDTTAKRIVHALPHSSRVNSARPPSV